MRGRRFENPLHALRRCVEEQRPHQHAMAAPNPLGSQGEILGPDGDACRRTQPQMGVPLLVCHTHQLGVPQELEQVLACCEERLRLVLEPRAAPASQLVRPIDSEALQIETPKVKG